MLTGDREEFLRYIRAWEAAVIAAFNLHLSVLKQIEKLYYGPKSFFSGASDLESDEEVIAYEDGEDCDIGDKGPADDPDDREYQPKESGCEEETAGGSSRAKRAGEFTTRLSKRPR